VVSGAPTYVIAEAGVNHDGSEETALDLVDAALDAGADAIKFQSFDPSAIAVDDAPLAEYQRAAEDARSQVLMLERLRLSDAAFARLAEHCRRRGITFLSTPFDEPSAAMLADLGVPAYKVGSGELTNLPFLRSLASRGLPLLVSTGMAELTDVESAVLSIGEAGAPPLALLHCVSSYPTPPEQANLRAMDTLREAFPGVPVGYSDHCLGIEISLAAVARGAAILERHLTLNRGRPGPDHAASLEPDELAELVRRVRLVEQALGTGVKEPQPAERDTRLVARRSLVALRDLEAGEVLSDETIGAKRPAGGLPPSALDELVGRRLARPLRRDEQISWEHVAP
jgi:N,N'-diacetyllegionaminate synthase